MSLRTVAAFGAALIGMLVSGCGVDNAKLLDQAEKQMQDLAAQGVPDSMFSNARLLLSEARGALLTSQAAIAKRDADSITATIARVEAWRADRTAKLGPEFDKLHAALVARRGSLTGAQRTVADSMLAAADALKAKGWMTQAYAKLQACDTFFAALASDESRAKEVTAGLPGVWAEQAQSTEAGQNAVRTKKFTFKKDGTVSFTEAMKGQSGPTLKEDWMYESSGKWDVKGDSVFIHVAREKLVHQTMSNLVNGKWVNTKKPPYDSTFKDGRHKELEIEYTYMKTSMKKL